MANKQGKIVVLQVIKFVKDMQIAVYMDLQKRWLIGIITNPKYSHHTCSVKWLNTNDDYFSNVVNIDRVKIFGVEFVKKNGDDSSSIYYIPFEYSQWQSVLNKVNSGELMDFEIEQRNLSDNIMIPKILYIAKIVSNKEKKKLYTEEEILDILIEYIKYSKYSSYTALMFDNSNHITEWLNLRLNPKL
jgi:hypothetical protein